MNLTTLNANTSNTDALDVGKTNPVKFNFKNLFILSLLCASLAACGGGGGGGGDSSEDFFSNDSCSLLKRAKSSSIDLGGLVTIPKIINGKTCDASSSPVVQLLLVNASNEGFVCTATMLTNQYALTAAHCFDEGINRAAVQIGTEVVGVEALKVDPDANDTPQRYYYDLAVIKLAKPVKVTPVPLLISKTAQGGDKLFIFGYGRSTPGTSDEGTDGILRGGVMKVDSTDAFSIFAKYDGQGENACFGDSGGPALMEVNGKLALVGTTSTGSSTANCGPGDINLFTNAQSAAALNFITTYVPNVGSL